MMIKKYLISVGVVASLGAIGCLQAAGKIVELKTDGQCSYDGASLPKSVYTFVSDKKAEDVIDNILEHTGLRRNFVISASDVPNAAAMTVGSERYLLYNQSFMKAVQEKTNTYWAGIGIMAHEVGHHLQGHTLDDKGSRPATELEADEYSGFVLQKMGATLEDAQAAMKAFASESGSSTHPAKTSRLAAIQAGWTKAAEQSPNAVKSDTPSVSTPKVAPTPATPSTTATMSGQYRINGDSTVTDTKTSLTWKQCFEGQSGNTCSGEASKYKWDDAMSKFGSGVSFAGHSDWRMPTKEELHTLVYCKNGTPQEEARNHTSCGYNYQSPTINQTAFPNTTPSAVFWSASPSASFGGSAWVVFFDLGYGSWYNKDNAFQVRLVRSGQ